jgi:mannose-1-phosphate guanylyltransferase
VWNGDILAPLDVTALLEDWCSLQKNQPPTLSHLEARARSSVAGSEPGGAVFGAVLAVVPRPRGEGTVGIDASGDVVRLRAERFGEEAAGADFLGISVVSGALRRTLPIPGCLVGEGFLPWLRAGGRIGTFQTDITWEDIGSVEAYLRANARWLRDAARSSFIAENTTIAPGIALSGSVIGEGATVTGEGLLEDCVVWPGATARAPASRTVFTTKGLIAHPE